MGGGSSRVEVREESPVLTRLPSRTPQPALSPRLSPVAPIEPSSSAPPSSVRSSAGARMSRGRSFRDAVGSVRQSLRRVGEPPPAEAVPAPPDPPEEKEASTLADEVRKRRGQRPKGISKGCLLELQQKWQREPCQVVTVRYDYDHEREDVLTLEKNNSITVLSKTKPGDGWWTGYDNDSRTTGIFPSSECSKPRDYRAEETLYAFAERLKRQLLDGDHGLVAFADTLAGAREKSSGDGMGRLKVAPATVFLSHARGMRVKQFFDTALAELGDEEYVWADLFMCSQFAQSYAEKEEKLAGMSDTMGAIGKVVAIMSPWRAPAALQSTQCLFELTCAMRCENAELAIVMSEEQRQDLTAELLKNAEHFTDWIQFALVNIDISSASVDNTDEDRELFDTQLEKMDGGSHQANVDLKTHMSEVWSLEVLRLLLSESAEASLRDPEAEAQAEADAGVGSKLINWAEKKTGLDLDGDGDIGEVGDGAAKRREHAQLCNNAAKVYRHEDVGPDMPRALECESAALEIIVELDGETKEVAKCVSTMAQDSFRLSLSLCSFAAELTGCACIRRGFTVLANDYYAEGDSVQALEIYERAAKMQEANAQTKSGNKNPGGGGSLNQIYNNMAVVHMDKVDYTTALDFYAKAAENKPDTPPDAETLGKNRHGFLFRCSDDLKDCRADTGATLRWVSPTAREQKRYSKKGIPQWADSAGGTGFTPRPAEVEPAA